MYVGMSECTDMDRCVGEPCRGVLGERGSEQGFVRLDLVIRSDSIQFPPISLRLLPVCLFVLLCFAFVRVLCL